jgi:hypothetical protein
MTLRWSGSCTRTTGGSAHREDEPVRTDEAQDPLREEPAPGAPFRLVDTTLREGEQFAKACSRHRISDLLRGSAA